MTRPSPKVAQATPKKKPSFFAELAKYPSQGIDIFLQDHTFTFTLLAFFVHANILLFIYGYRHELDHVVTPRRPELQRVLTAVARAFGTPINLNAFLVLLVACKSIVTGIRKYQVLNLIIHFDKVFPAFHMIAGFCILVSVLFHAIFHLTWIVRFDAWNAGLWNINMCVGTGIALVLALTAIASFAVPKWRKRNFKLLFRLHIFGAAAFFPLLALHGMWNAVPFTWKIIAAPMALYVTDRLYRHFEKTSELFDCKKGLNFKVTDGNILGLSLPRLIDFKPGQYAELQVPEIDSSFHPFTIASAPHDHELRFYIRNAGPWTGKLRELAESGANVGVRYRGPYGAPAQHVSSFQNVVLISGGVGATPFCSIANSCNFRKSEEMSDSMHFNKMRKEEEDVADGERFYDFIRSASGKTSDRLPAEMEVMEELDSSQASFGTIDSEISDASRSLSNLSTFSRGNIISHMKMAGSPNLLSSFLLLWTFLARVLLILYGKVFDNFAIDDKLYGSRVISIVELCLGVVFVVHISTTIVLDMWSVGLRQYFSTLGRFADFFLLLPASYLSVFAIASCMTGLILERKHAVLHAAVLMPYVAVLLFIHLYRQVGHRVLLTDRKQSSMFERTEKMDFIFTTPTSKSDLWLQDELLGIAKGGFVGLHRFVTREKLSDSEEPAEVSRRFNTVFGRRPEFDSIFRKIASTAPSNSTIGVLFCGPPAMQNSIRTSLKKAQTLSMLRGKYIRKLSSSSDGSQGIEKLSETGANVRFMFRKENF